jgi:hypothetical protein
VTHVSPCQDFHLTTLKFVLETSKISLKLQSSIGDESATAPKDLLKPEFYLLEYSTAGKEQTTTTEQYYIWTF